jgi:hypothetical protein
MSFRNRQNSEPLASFSGNKIIKSGKRKINNSL